jgi:hypothetical protein
VSASELYVASVQDDRGSVTGWDTKYVLSPWRPDLSSQLSSAYLDVQTCPTYYPSAYWGAFPANYPVPTWASRLAQPTIQCLLGSIPSLLSSAYLGVQTCPTYYPVPTWPSRLAQPTIQCLLGSISQPTVRCLLGSIPSLLSSTYWGTLHNRCSKLSTHLCLVLRRTVAERYTSAPPYISVVSIRMAALCVATNMLFVIREQKSGFANAAKGLGGLITAGREVKPLRIPHCLESRLTDGVRWSASRTGRILLPKKVFLSETE